MTADQQVVEEFRVNRNLLFSVAYQILGSAVDAEDAVQDAWLKWCAVDGSRVDDAKAYLVRIVSNLAIDRLRAAKVRRETYVGPWLPEPLPTGPDSVDEVTATAESVSMALLVVLESLSPLERAVFVLTQVFGYSNGEVAEMLDRSSESVRQAGHRAREHVRARRPRFVTDRRRQRQVTEQFLAAAAGGDINALMELLAPDVTLWTDGGGKVRHLMRPISGVKRVAAAFARIARRPYQGLEMAEMGVDIVEINGGPGIVFAGAGRVIATFSLDLDESGRIASIYNVANPEKLRAVAAARIDHIEPES